MFVEGRAHTGKPVINRAKHNSQQSMFSAREETEIWSVCACVCVRVFVSMCAAGQCGVLGRLEGVWASLSPCLFVGLFLLGQVQNTDIRLCKKGRKREPKGLKLMFCVINTM